MDKINQLNDIFTLFNIGAHCLNFNQYKNSFSYDIELKPKTRVKSIERYLNEISMMLKVSAKPLLHVLPEQGIVRLEYINNQPHSVNFFDLGLYTGKPDGDLQCLLGEEPNGDLVWCDIATLPHMLVAGTTGSGKSTVLHTIIANLLLNSNVQIDLIDTKNIEFQQYKDLSNINISFDYLSSLTTIKKLYQEMEDRYSSMTCNFATNFPYRVLIIDEFADLIMQDQSYHLYHTLCKLAQKSRSAKIHIILATQRPSATIIDGTIKANFPARLSCRTASHVDSRIILDTVGAEKLNGHGDAILKTNDYTRLQIAYTTPDEVYQCFKHKQTTTSQTNYSTTN